MTPLPSRPFSAGDFPELDVLQTLIQRAGSLLRSEIVCEIDLSDSDRYRTHWPFLRDRRIDSYAPVQRRYIDE